MQRSRIFVFSVIASLGLLSYGVAFGLTESVDLFGQSNSADIILNDIWIEPQNPENGQGVSIHVHHQSMLSKIFSAREKIQPYL